MKPIFAIINKFLLQLLKLYRSLAFLNTVQ